MKCKYSVFDNVSFLFPGFLRSVIAAVLSFTAVCLYADAGRSGALTLVESVGSRASGMGEAYTAMKGDLYTIDYNPAGIYGIEEKELAVSYKKGLTNDMFTGAVSYGTPVSEGIMAFRLLYYNAGQIQLIDLSGTGRTVNAQTDYLLSICYSKSVKKGLYAGLNVKMLNSRLMENFSANTYTLDIGAIYEYPGIPVAIGAAVQNLWGKLKYADSEDELPMKVRCGLSYNLVNRFEIPVLITADLVKVNDGALNEYTGLEYTVNENFSVRAGYKIGDDIDSFCIGFGFVSDFFNLDYSYNMAERLNSIHKISISKKLGFAKTGKVVAVAIKKMPASKYVRGSPDIPEKAHKKLRKIVSFLESSPEYDVVEIVGHASNEGSQEFNRELSINRAQKVADYFRNKIKNIKFEIIIKGMGDTQPIVSNDTEKGRAKNRRVEIFLKKSN